MKWKCLLCLLHVNARYASAYTIEAQQDEIQHLPGADMMPSKQFSGYLNISSTKFIHYYFIESEKKLLEMCHYYYVTNLQLFSHYCNLLPDKKPLGVLHDLPDIQLINKVRQRVNKPKFSEKPKVIWIGNSKWGSRQGVKDHKG